MLQGGSLAHRLLTEVLPQPAVDQTVQEALEGDGQGLRERGQRRALPLPAPGPPRAAAALQTPWPSPRWRGAAWDQPV